MQWIDDLNNSIDEIEKSLNVLIKLLSIKLNLPPSSDIDTLVDLADKLRNKVFEVSESVRELGNISRNMMKLCILSITKFSNENITEIDLNPVLDNIPFLDEELLISSYNCNLIKDVKITNATRCMDNSKINDETLDMINFNTISKVFRMDITKNNNNGEIVDDSYTSIVNGDTKSSIKVSVPKDQSEEWSTSIDALYSGDFNGTVSEREVVSTHYNNSSIQYTFKEISEIYTSGIIK